MTSTLLQQAVEQLKRPEGDWSLSAALSAMNEARHLVESALQQQPEPVAPSDEEIVAWVDSFIRKQAYNYPVAVQIATEAAKWVRSRTAPPALQQQEEPREVAQRYEQMRLTLIGQVHELIDIAERHVWIDDAEERRRTEGAIAHARKVTAPYNYNGVMLPAYPSPQDFTLPMVEEGKGTGGVPAFHPCSFCTTADACGERGCADAARGREIAAGVPAPSCSYPNCECDGFAVRCPLQNAPVVRGMALREHHPNCAYAGMSPQETNCSCPPAAGVDGREEALRRAGAAGLDPDPDVVGARAGHFWRRAWLNEP